MEGKQMVKRMLILAQLTFTAALADEVSYTLNVDNCSGGCGTSPFGTVREKELK